VRNDRRVRRLVVDGTVWRWTVRQRVRPVYADCRLALSLFTEEPVLGGRRRLSLVFAPTPTGAISNCCFESGTVVRLPDRSHLNLYEPGTVRRLLEAALELHPPRGNVDVDGWPCFSAVVDRGTALNATGATPLRP